MKNIFNKKISLENSSIYTKFVVASLFMFVLPLVLITFVLLLILPKKLTIDPMMYSRIVIVLIIVSGVFGYFLIRKTVKSVLDIIRSAKNYSEGKGGNISALHDDELKDLARAFNRITGDLENKIEELENSRKLTKELFQKIGSAVTSGQQLDSLLSIIIQSMAKVLSSKSAFIALYNKDSGRLYMKDYFGPHKNTLKNTILFDNKGVVGLVVKMAKPVTLESHLPDDDVLHYDNISCIPIITKGKVIGILGVIDEKDPAQVRSENIPLIENIANQVAVSIGNFELNKDIENTYYETLITLARVVQAKDPYTRGHLERVEKYVEQMADKLKLDNESKKVLKGGALLHDLGKVGISDDILKKDDTFDVEEYDIMKQHPIIGENILKPLRTMEKLSSLVRHHHEWYDGTGYPDGLKGEDIPTLSRILTIADIYDALTTERPYKKAMSKEDALETIKKYAGNKLDPKLTDIFVDLMK